MTSPCDGKKALQILDEGMGAGARAQELALLLGVGLSTLQRWRRQFTGAGSSLVPLIALTRAKAANAMLGTVSAKKNAIGSCSSATSPNSPRYHPARSCRCLLRGLYTCSESSFYRVLHARGQVHRRARARPKARLSPNVLWIGCRAGTPGGINHPSLAILLDAKAYPSLLKDQCYLLCSICRA